MSSPSSAKQRRLSSFFTRPKTESQTKSKVSEHKPQKEHETPSSSSEKVASDENKSKKMAECSSSIEDYDFSHKYRGQALIFLQIKFDDEGFPDRTNASIDSLKMKQLFEGLDFKVKLYKDLSSTEITDKLKKAANCEYNKQSDCFACVFSTHGSEEREINRKQNFVTWKNAVYGKDCTPIFVDDILDIFSNRKCASLMDKPKLFFIQACRSRHEQSGDEYDYGRDIHLVLPKIKKSAQKRQRGVTDSLDDTDTETLYERQPGEENGNQGHLGGTATIETAKSQMTQEDSDFIDIYADWTEAEDTDEINEISEEQQNDLESEIVTDETDVKGAQDSLCIPGVPDVPVELTPINCPNDCLVVYPVMPGKLAFRNKEGSWLLHFLHKNKDLLVKKRSLLQYLTKVCADMAEQTFNPESLNKQTKVTAHLIHTLSKDVKFIPKNQKSHMGIFFDNLLKKLKII